jgi:endonuclease/exonuclease/phosphatase family metal-dependent hydrolase
MSIALTDAITTEVLAGIHETGSFFTRSQNRAVNDTERSLDTKIIKTRTNIKASFAMIETDRRNCQISMYAVALQEVTDPLYASIVPGKTRHATLWEEALDEYFVHRKNMIKLAVNGIGGTILAIYVLRKYADIISGLCTTTISLGVLNITKNKGAVGVRFRINEDTVCIVCAHMAAGEGKCNERLKDYNHITQSMRFAVPTTQKHRTVQNLVVSQHSHIIFMGDLNFRITPNPDLALLKKIDLGEHKLPPTEEKQMLTRLRRYDELLNAMSWCNIFNGFKEGVLTFRPTYKYTSTTDKYDTVTSRMPAWTDRILWRGEIALLEYCTKHMIGSDHKPLHAVLELKKIL